MRRLPPHAPPARGLSLIELMVVLTVLAVAATLAYPSYEQQWLKARRLDAFTAIAGIQLAQERWRSERPDYAAELGHGDGRLGLAEHSAQGHYRLALSTDEAQAATTYRVTATAQGRQARDHACATMTLEVHAGHRRYAPSACWGRR